MKPQKTYSQKRIRWQHSTLAIALLMQIALCGCAQQTTTPYPATMFAPTESPQMPVIESAAAPTANTPANFSSTPQNIQPTTQPTAPPTTQPNTQNATPKNSNNIIRAQDGGYANGTPDPYSPPGTTNAFMPVQDGNVQPPPPDSPNGTFIQQPPGMFSNQTPNQNSPQVGAPNQTNPAFFNSTPGGVLQQFPQNYADLDIYVQEAQTGRIMVGGAFNSDNGLTGNIIIDEKNFDIMRFPRSFGEIIDGTAWRGAGQSFRMELVPGNDVQRYLASFTEPYLFNSLVSLSTSGYFFSRNYFDWDEQRLGGRVALGYRLNHDLSIAVGTRLENVKIFDPRVNTSDELNAAVGSNSLYTGFVSLTHDTRDHPFLATEGAFLQLRLQQAFGDFDYSRADLDYRRYFLLYQRPDGSGRHTLNVGTKLGFSGAQRRFSKTTLLVAFQHYAVSIFGRLAHSRRCSRWR